MGIFGFFLFLSVMVIAHNWKSVRIAQLQRDMFMHLLDSGQAVDFDKLLMLGPQPQPVLWAKWKIGVLVVLACSTLVLCVLYWEAGTMPGVLAAIFALLVAAATWNHERKLAGRK